MNKTILEIIFLLLIIIMFEPVFFTQLVKAHPGTIYYVDDDNLAGPWNGTLEYPYQNITNGLDRASDNDTIFVYNGTYYENLIVNKALSLIGENKDTTIIDGSKNGTVVRITSNNVAITGFTIQNSGTNTPDCGIFVWRRAEVTISNNTIRNNFCGIEMRESNCSYITRNLIANNTFRGVSLSSSDGNKVYFNTISENGIGAHVSYNVVPNTIYDNNFIDNPTQGEGSAEWDNGAEGNYWSDYNGTDLDGDGIGDAVVPHLGIDDYPLMGIVTFFNACTWQQTTYYVHMSSNSTVCRFQFNQDDKAIAFNITNTIGAPVFCRVSIPRQLIWCDSIQDWQVITDTTQIPYNATQNADYTYIYFTYHQVPARVNVEGTYVLPEFSGNIMLWMSIIVSFTILIITIKQRKSRDILSEKQ